VLSEQRRINGGSPQGTLLGNVLFIITTDFLEKESEQRANEASSISTDSEVEITHQNIGKISLESEDQSDSLLADPNENVCEGISEVNKFIDDFLAVESIRTTEYTERYENDVTERLVRAKASEKLLETVKINGQKIGLNINQKKTQLLCISEDKEYEMKSYIEGEERKESTDSMKILGFTFGHRPTVSAHVKALKDKYRKRAWVVRHLKRAGVPQEDLKLIYFSLVRSVLEYASCAFHSMLSKN
jgi:hypothetical protein